MTSRGVASEVGCRGYPGLLISDILNNEPMNNVYVLEITQASCR